MARQRRPHGARKRSVSRVSDASDAGRASDGRYSERRSSTPSVSAGTGSGSVPAAAAASGSLSRWPVVRQTTRSSAPTTPSARSFRSPASEAADAGSTPMPAPARSRCASVIASSETATAVPPVSRIPGSACCLDAGELRHVLDRERAGSDEFTKRLVQCRGVPGVTYRQDDPVGDGAVVGGELFDDLESDRLLALEAERVQRVEQVGVAAVGEPLDEVEAVVEVAVDLEDARSVEARLGELSRRDLSCRQEDERLHSRSGAVGGKRRTRVTRRGTGESLDAQ